MCPLRILARPVLPLLALSLVGCVSLRPFADVRREVPESGYLKVDGHLVHVEQAGAGEPVLLIHGFGESTYTWRKVIPGLAADYRVIALDLYGFGYTERPHDRESYTREGQALLILDVLDALGVDRAHFVGHSYGGALTLYIAARYPERIRSMVLVDSAAPTYPQDRRSPFARSKLLDSLLARTYALRPGSLRRALRNSLWDDSLVTPELVTSYLERLKIEGATDAFYGLTAPSPPDGVTVDLGTLEIPAFVVWGTEDRIIAIAEGREAARRLPLAEFAAIEKSGHLPMEDQPEELVTLVKAFLAHQNKR